MDDSSGTSAFRFNVSLEFSSVSLTVSLFSGGTLKSGIYNQTKLIDEH